MPNRKRLFQRHPVTWILTSLLLLSGAAAAYRWANRGEPHHAGRTSENRPDGDASVSFASDNASAATVAVLTSNTQKTQAALQQQLDPLNDNWRTEALHDRVAAHLKIFQRLLATDDAILPADVETMAADTFQCAPLRPAKLQVVFQDQAITVWREPSSSATAEAPQSIRLPESGKSSLASALNDWRASFSGVSELRVEFKTFGVDTSDQRLTTTVFTQATGQHNGGAVQQNATWRMHWLLNQDDQAARLDAIEVHDFEEIHTNAAGWLYADCTEAVLGANLAYQDQLRFGTDYWMRRLDRHLSPRLLEGHIGFAVGDVNGDGLDDLYVCQPGGLPNRLFLQNDDGTASDASADSGVNLLDWSYSALFVELNNDGHQDLAILADGQLLIFAGQGTGRFELRTRLVGSLEYALCAADYDNDGDLDLYACNYFAEPADELAQLGRTDPLFDSNTGGRNVLFRNEGEWRFADVTDDVGLDRNNRRWTLAAAWEDYDNDGDQDLYVVNDFGHNSLYRNDDGRFEEVGAQAGALDANQGMSVSWADYDQDGWMDVYVSNMFSAAGNRVTRQPSFMPGRTKRTKSLYQQLAKGNTLLRNLGNGNFADVSHQAGVTMGRWAWASLFTDINNDGREDLLVSNGYLTQDSADDL